MRYLFVRSAHIWLLLGASCLALSGCGGGGSGGSGLNDNSGSVDESGQIDSGLPSPTGNVPAAGFGLASATPASSSTNTALTTRIRLLFTQPLLNESVVGAILVLKDGGERPAIDISHVPGSALLELIPRAQLRPNTTYTVVLGSTLLAADGSSFAPLSWQFTTAGNLGSTEQSTIDSCMSAENQAMLAAVNAARASARSCGGTSYPAVPALSWSCKLRDSALQHSLDMARNGTMSHTGSDGSSMGDRIRANGYEWRSAAENVAFGYQTVDSVMSGWLGSSGHCRNIMASSSTEMGSAAAFPADSSSSNRKYWTQNFASPAN